LYLKKLTERVIGVIMPTREKGFLSAADAALKVRQLLDLGRIPLPELERMIMKYGYGDSIENYWEHLCPEDGNRLASLFRPCYQATGNLKPEYQHATVELAKALFWVDNLQHPRFVQQLSGTKMQDIVPFESFFHLEMLRISKDLGVTFIEQVNCSQEGSDTLVVVQMDPWAAASQAPLNKIPSADQPDQSPPLNRIRAILELIMRWMVSFELAGLDDQVTALSHLIDLIARHGNVPVEFSILNGRVYPIVLIGEREKSTMRSRGSASERPPSLQPVRSLTPL
jgi:hypothetical protein